MPIVDSMLMEIEQEAKTTQRVLDRIPENKLGWKPHAKSYSLGQLGLHIARAQGALAEAASKDTHEIGNMSQPEPASRKEILDTFAQSTAKATQILAKMDDARLMAMWTADQKWKSSSVHAASQLYSRHHDESHLSSSRAAFRLPQIAGCPYTVDLRSQRR